MIDAMTHEERARFPHQTLAARASREFQDRRELHIRQIEDEAKSRCESVGRTTSRLVTRRRKDLFARENTVCR
jgi:hypothetical protein